MKADAVLTAHIEIAKNDEDNTLWRSKRIWETCLLSSAVAALTSGLVGIVFAVASFLGMVSHDGAVSVVSAFLLILSLSALIGAAHCLDKLGEIKLQFRMRSYRGKCWTK
jgi:predicted Co/Zn/Cd cation transporter (cation efflux family)